MIVWRLEDAEGCGIYRRSFYEDPAIEESWWDCYWSYAIGAMNYTESDPVRHPDVDEDARLNWDEAIHSGYLFGFATILQYYRWVHKELWRQRLGECGVMLNCYEVDECYTERSKKQVIFASTFATLIASVPPDFCI